MDWLEQNLFDPGLSLDLVVKTFGHSTTYWSRRFQNMSGMRFTDLVWKKRVAYVKERLVNSDESIKDIVQSVGYWNISSFARRFKQEEGMTANQWREVERNNSTSK